jgi:MFS family permease
VTHVSTLDYASPPTPPATARLLWPAYVAESLSSVGNSLLMVGIFFLTKQQFGWGLRENLLLAAAQGAAYVAGSLAAHAVANRFGRRRGLVGVFTILSFLPLLPLALGEPAWMVAGLIAYTLVASLAWPALESLVSSDADAHALSRRVGLYNLVWSGTSAVTFGASGTIIAYWPGGMFALPAVVHAISALLLWLVPEVDDAADRATGPMPAPATTSTKATLSTNPPTATAQLPPLPPPPSHATPEPQLLAQRTLAMWLARISLPATYVVVYSLMAMMPSLPVIRPLDTTMQTVAGSVWMVARLIAFLYLGATVWWHTRPRLLLAAAAVMLVAFVGVAVRPSDVLGRAAGATQAIDLASMIAWQIVLGMVMGIIYAGSLYFGMVLSEGSTEHGGYHEALIGLGSILGPGTAALTQWKWPDNLRAGVIAVSCVIGLSLVAAMVATIRASRRTT